METIGLVLTALSDPTRRAMLESVRGQPKSVNEIAGAFEVSRPAISQHLRVLEKARLVRRQKSGRHNYYGLDFQGLNQLRTYVEHFWEDVLEAFQAAAVREADRRRKKR